MGGRAAGNRPPYAHFKPHHQLQKPYHHLLPSPTIKCTHLKTANDFGLAAPLVIRCTRFQIDLDAERRFFENLVVLPNKCFCLPGPKTHLCSSIYHFSSQRDSKNFWHKVNIFHAFLCVVWSLVVKIIMFVICFWVDVLFWRLVLSNNNRRLTKNVRHIICWTKIFAMCIFRQILLIKFHCCCWFRMDIFKLHSMTLIVSLTVHMNCDLCYTFTWLLRLW